MMWFHLTLTYQPVNRVIFYFINLNTSKEAPTHKRVNAYVHCFVLCCSVVHLGDETRQLCVIFVIVSIAWELHFCCGKQFLCELLYIYLQ